MFTLRALARSLPRATPRFTNTTSHFITKSSFQASSRSLLTRIPQATTAAFSTSSVWRDSAGQQLGAKLDAEFLLEQENTEQSADSDKNVQSFLDQNAFWTVVSGEGEQDVTLTRKYDDEDITVAFSIADFNNPAALDDVEDDQAFLDEEDEDIDAANSKGGAVNQGRPNSANIKIAPEDQIAPADQESLDEELDYDSQQAFAANVSVLIQRPGKGALRADLIADNGRWTINTITHLPKDITGTQSAQELLNNHHETLYAGPPFAQLDEEVQSLIEQYLEVRGIDTSLALFVPDYIDVKEQHLYQGWLQNMRDFVE